MERPILNKELDSKTFHNYYFLKEELMNFCRENGMPTSGSKIEIADRIAYFLDTGKIKAASAKRKKAAAMFDIYEDTKIEDDFVCSQNHRSFFREHIGSSFSFNLAFQQWLKSNKGKTYKERLQPIIKLLRIRKKEKQKLISNSSITLIFEIFLRIIRENP